MFFSFRIFLFIQAETVNVLLHYQSWRCNEIVSKLFMSKIEFPHVAWTELYHVLDNQISIIHSMSLLSQCLPTIIVPPHVHKIRKFRPISSLTHQPFRRNGSTRPAGIVFSFIFLLPIFIILCLHESGLNKYHLPLDMSRQHFSNFSK